MRRRGVVAAGAVAILLAGGMGAGAYLLFGRTDEHTTAACAATHKAAHAVTLEDGLFGEMKAVSEAAKSGDPGLRKAANTTSLTTRLPFDSPLYENPEDLRFKAVSAWCGAHR